MTPHTRVRHDKIDTTGVFTLRHGTKLHHIGVGRGHKGRRVIVLVCDLDIRVLSEDGELLRRLTLDRPSTINPSSAGPDGLPFIGSTVHDVLRHHMVAGGSSDDAPFGLHTRRSCWRGRRAYAAAYARALSLFGNACE
jgi:hypothetical protein